MNKIEKRIQGLFDFTEEMRRMNRKVSNKLLSFNIIKADSEVREKLFLEEGEEVYVIERLRYGDHIPVLFEKLYLPHRIFKNLAPSTMESSFYEYVEGMAGIKISHCVQTVEAMSANTRISNLLEIRKDSPVLFMTRNTFLDRGFPFEYVRSYYRGDQYRFIQHAAR